MATYDLKREGTQRGIEKSLYAFITFFKEIFNILLVVNIFVPEHHISLPPTPVPAYLLHFYISAKKYL